MTAGLWSPNCSSSFVNFVSSSDASAVREPHRFTTLAFFARSGAWQGGKTYISVNGLVDFPKKTLSMSRQGYCGDLYAVLCLPSSIPVLWRIKHELMLSIVVIDPLLDMSCNSELSKHDESSDSVGFEDKGWPGASHSRRKALNNGTSPGNPWTSTFDQSKGKAFWRISRNEMPTESFSRISFNPSEFLIAETLLSWDFAFSFSSVDASRLPIKRDS